MSAADELRFVTLSGLEHALHVWHGGSGPAWLLLHGFLDQGDSFSDMADWLKKRGSVLALDFRGHGQSAWIGQGGYYHFPDYVRDVIELFQHTPELHAPCVLVGHSMGGSVATYATPMLDNLVGALALVEGTGPPAVAPEQACTRMKTWLDQLRGVPNVGMRRFSGLSDVAARLHAAHPELGIETCEQWAARLTVRERDGLRWRYDPLHRTTSPTPFSSAGYRSFAAAIDVPVLLVRGEQSRFMRAQPDELAEREAAFSGPVQRAHISGAGHMMHLSHPEALARTLLEFVTIPTQG